MGWFLLIGIFCVLAVIGFFVTGSPFKFAIGGIVFLIALAFVSLVVIVVWTMNDPCSAPFTDHNSTYCQNRARSASQSVVGTAQVPATSNDPFPYNNNECDSNGCPQYEWYDRHNVPMSNRCYPSMTTPCTATEWKQALGN